MHRMLIHPDIYIFNLSAALGHFSNILELARTKTEDLRTYTVLVSVLMID